jgi:hypothetical protein
MSTRNQPNFELLKEAYAIIGGIPARQLQLHSIVAESDESFNSNDSKTKHCGTIACGIGWLGLHPEFQRRGLKVNKHGDTFFNGAGMSYPQAASKLFGIDYDTALDMFSARGDSPDDTEASEKLSDKQLLQFRIRNFLRKHGQLKSQLAKKGA